MFLQVKTRPISLLGKFRTWIACCQRGFGSRWSVFLGRASLDSNCQRDGAGQFLPQFTPCATASSSGINVFVRPLPSDHNYVFPPFVLIAPFLKCILEQDFYGTFTIIILDLKPRRFWWALLQSLAVDRVLSSGKEN